MGLAILVTPILKVLYSGYLPDFLIAFTFFTSLCLATLHKRFNHHSAETGLAVSLGLALATGLVWWEYEHSLSIRNLGSIGILLAFVVAVIIVYHVLEHLGSKSASWIIAIALILIFLSLYTPLDLDLSVLYTLIFACILLGFVVHAIKVSPRETYRPVIGLSRAPPEIIEADLDLKRLHRDRNLNFNLDKHLRTLKNTTEMLERDPNEASEVYSQISALLPVEGYLTRRMAKLRKMAHHVRKGHIARLKETKSLVSRLSSKSLARASAKLIHGYQNELDMDKRLERLDAAVAANERRILELLRKAREYSQVHRFQDIPDLIKHAERLQYHNAKLFETIERTERKLSNLAFRIVKEQKEACENDETR